MARQRVTVPGLKSVMEVRARIALGRNRCNASYPFCQAPLRENSSPLFAGFQATKTLNKTLALVSPFHPAAYTVSGIPRNGTAPSSK